MQHTGADTLRHQTAPAVFPEAHNGETHHLGAASGHRSAACQPCQAKRGTDGGGGDGKRQRHADNDRHQDPHEEGLQLRSPHNGLTHGDGGGANGPRHQCGKANTGQDRDHRCYQNINLCLLADGFTNLGSENGHEEHSQRAACTAQYIGGKANGNQRKQHQWGRLQGIADGHRHGRPHHQRAQAANGIAEYQIALLDGQKRVSQESDAELFADGVQNGTHQQRTEQSLCHGGHGVDEIALSGESDVLPRQKGPYFFHICYLISRKVK